MNDRVVVNNPKRPDTSTSTFSYYTGTPDQAHNHHTTTILREISTINNLSSKSSQIASPITTHIDRSCIVLVKESRKPVVRSNRRLSLRPPPSRCFTPLPKRPDLLISVDAQRSCSGSIDGTSFIKYLSSVYGKVGSFTFMPPLVFNQWNDKWVANFEQIHLLWKSMQTPPCNILIPRLDI